MTHEERLQRLPNITAVWYHWQRLVDRRVSGGMLPKEAQDATTREMIQKVGATLAGIKEDELTAALIACNDGRDELLYNLLYGEPT